MSDTLIVYFSHQGERYQESNYLDHEHGNTEQAVKIMQELCGCDTFRLVPQKPYPRSYRECVTKSKTEKLCNKRPLYVDEVNTSKYHNIILAYPNWWSDVPMIVATFLSKHNLGKHNIYLLATHGGGGLGHSFQTVQSLCPNSTIVDTIAIDGEHASSSRETLRLWLVKNHLMEVTL